MIAVLQNIRITQTISSTINGNLVWVRWLVFAGQMVKPSVAGIAIRISSIVTLRMVGFGFISFPKKHVIIKRTISSTKTSQWTWVFMTRRHLMCTKSTAKSCKNSAWPPKGLGRFSRLSIFANACAQVSRHCLNGMRRLKGPWFRNPIIQSMH